MKYHIPMLNDKKPIDIPIKVHFRNETTIIAIICPE
jgi:hypothetical protein